MVKKNSYVSNGKKLVYEICSHCNVKNEELEESCLSCGKSLLIKKPLEAKERKKRQLKRRVFPRLRSNVNVGQR